MQERDSREYISAGSYLYVVAWEGLFKKPPKGKGSETPVLFLILLIYRVDLLNSLDP